MWYASLSGIQNLVEDPIIEATKAADIDLIKKLVAVEGSNINFPGRNNNTPLMIASQTNNKKLIKTLIDLGANVHAKNSQGVTPLMFAVQYEQADIVKLLVAAHADIYVQDKEGRNCLQYAASAGNKETLDFLLAKKTRCSCC